MSIFHRHGHKKEINLSCSRLNCSPVAPFLSLSSLTDSSILASSPTYRNLHNDPSYRFNSPDRLGSSAPSRSLHHGASEVSHQATVIQGTKYGRAAAHIHGSRQKEDENRAAIPCDQGGISAWPSSHFARHRSLLGCDYSRSHSG